MNNSPVEESYTSVLLQFILLLNIVNTFTERRKEEEKFANKLTQLIVDVHVSV